MTSLTTDVSPNNNNKRNSELLGDSMICDDASQTDCDVDGSKKQINTNILKNKAEIPPKNDTPSSEVLSIGEPPRNKKRKLSAFDELLKNLNYGVLYTILTKLLSFLKSANNKCIFFLTKDYEEFFEMVMQDITILKSKSLDNDYRHISNKIINAATGKLLFYEFEYRPGFHKKVMVIKKVNTMDQSGNSTASISCSSGSLMPPPSQTSTKVDTNDQSRSLVPVAITSGFKSHCLRTLLVFINNDAVKTKEFPELNTEQAKFMQLLLEKVNIDHFDSDIEVTDLYRAVVDAVRIKELKYEFRIKCNESWGGKKSVVFEKVPVLIPSETAVNSDQTAENSKQSVAFKIPVHVSTGSTLNLNQTAGKSEETMNPKTDVRNTEDPKADAPEPDGSNPEFSKSDAPKSHGPKIDEPKTDTLESHGPKIDVHKQDAFKSHDPKLDVPQTDTPKSNVPKIDVLKPDAPKSQAPKISDSWALETSDSGASKSSDSGAPTTEPPQPDIAEPWFKKPKPLIRTKQQINYKNQRLFLKNIPKKIIKYALNTILDFLLNDVMVKLVLVPKTKYELKFYRRCIILCNSDVNLSLFGEEFRELHCRISHLLCRFDVQVTKRCQNAFNPITGIKEVTYLKTPIKYISESDTCTEAKETSKVGESQSTPVQNALQLAATDNIKLDKVINLNQSLRSKKKDKKRKKAELKKAKKSKGASSSSSTSRESSRDRAKSAMAAAFVPPGPKVAKRSSSEISQSPKKTSTRWSSVDSLRNEKLREAMSVPVQSDKAMRMMLGMGWNGGALGPRGDGITEPLMPALEIARGAGFGLISHRTQTSHLDTVPVPKKPKEPPPPLFEPKNDIVVEKTKKNDVVVEKTKKLLLEDVTFDTIMNTTEPEKFNVLLSKPSKSPVEHPKPTTSKLELPTKTRFSIETQNPENADLKVRLPCRMEILHSIWDLINSDVSCKSLKYDVRLNKKQKKMVTLTTQTLGAKKDNLRSMFSQEEIPICQQIRKKILDTQIAVEARFFWDFRSIDLLKVPKKLDPPTELLKLPSKFDPPTPIAFENSATITTCNQIINSENLKSYILSTNGTTPGTLKTLKNMQFKVLFLMNMLNFVKSLNEEYEVTYNKVLNAKEKLYIENVVDQINMRIKFGSSPAETKLGDQIREHVKDAFLGVMYDHDHTIITLSKYYRFKRLNRPDNAVRRKTRATVNLDDFTSENLIEPKINTNEPFDREIKYDDDYKEVKYEVSVDKFEVFEDNYEHTNEVTETDNTKVSTENTTANVSDDETSETLPISNELGPYDSDDSSVEDYKNVNAKVLKLLPGEEGVNLSNFLYLYDKEKTNTAGIRNNSIINNDSASNMTENRNNKNNSGNGNVVIDNNDNQFIDMKRAGSNAQDTQKENNIDSEKAEYMLKTEDLDSNIVVIEDSDSDNDCTENEAKDKIKSITENLPLEDCKGETGVIIQDSDADKTMTIINITEDLMNGITEPVHGIVKDDSNAIINLDDVVDAINKDKSKVAIDPDDSIPVITTGETMAVIDKDESQAVIDIDESKAAVIQAKSKEVINKSEPMAVINQGESNAVININDSMATINLNDAADIINKDVSEVLIVQGELMKVFNTVESLKDKKVAQIKEGTSINPNDENVVKDDLVIKSDCDRIKKDNIVLSEEFCNTQSVKSSRVQTVDKETDFLYNKDTEIKNVRIGHTLHPIRKLSAEEIEKIQWHISNCIKLATELPLLKCHGVQNGALFYTCHNKKTYDWLQNTIGVASYVKVFDTREVTKMALKLCGYFDFDSNYLFKMLEMYNKKISTKEWVVEKTEKKCDYIIFIVKMDEFSIQFIQESDLALFVGIDKVHFSLIWE